MVAGYGLAPLRVAVLVAVAVVVLALPTATQAARARTGRSSSSSSGLDANALASLSDVSLSDDLSSDSELTDTLEHLLAASVTDTDTDDELPSLASALPALDTTSELSETVHGEAFGDEPLTTASSSSAPMPPPQALGTTEVAVEHEGEVPHEVVHRDAAALDAAAVVAAADQPLPPPPAQEAASAAVASEHELEHHAAEEAPAAAAAAPVAAETMKFREVSNSNDKGPIVPLTETPTTVAVPIPSAPVAKDDSSSNSNKHSKKHSHHDEDAEDEEEDSSSVDDLPRFMAQKALTQAAAELALGYTPEEQHWISQGGVEGSSDGSGTRVATTTAERIKTAIWIALLIGAVVAILEASTFMADYALKESYLKIDNLLSKTYKTMMIIGLASFLLICYARFNWLAKLFKDYSPTLLLDLLIVMSVMGLLYLAVMCGLIGYVLYAVNRFKQIEYRHRTEHDVNRLENQINKLKDEFNARSCAYRFFGSCMFRYHLKSLEFEYQYCNLKQQFVNQHKRRFLTPFSAAAVSSAPLSAVVQANVNPPLSYQTFDFHVYMRKNVQNVMEEVAAVHWQVWAVVATIIALNGLRMLAFKSVDGVSFVYISVILLWVVTGFVYFLSYSVSATHEELAEHYPVYLPDRAGNSASSATPNNAQQQQQAEGKNAAMPLIDAKAGDSSNPNAAPESDDPDDELGREAGYIQGGGCCGAACQCTQTCKSVGCCSAPNKQQELFCCKTASSVTKGLQLSVLLACLIIPAWIVDLYTYVGGEATWVKVLVNILLVVPPLISLILLIPTMLPPFILTTSVASMSRLSALRSTVLKLQSATYRAKKDADVRDWIKHNKPSGGDGGAAAGARSLNTDFLDDTLDEKHGGLSSGDDDTSSDEDNDDRKSVMVGNGEHKRQMSDMEAGMRPSMATRTPAASVAPSRESLAAVPFSAALRGPTPSLAPGAMPARSMAPSVIGGPSAVGPTGSPIQRTQVSPSLSTPVVSMNARGTVVQTGLLDAPASFDRVQPRPAPAASVAASPSLAAGAPARAASPSVAPMGSDVAAFAAMGPG